MIVKASMTSFQLGNAAAWLRLGAAAAAIGLGLALPTAQAGADTAESGHARPFHEAEVLFPLETWHNHASCIVETPRGDLLVCWFHGSGERTADDVKIEGARKRKGSRQWSQRFTMADTPGYPDTNCAMFIDPEGRLWLLWPTILANRWESALMKYRVASDYHDDGPPRWSATDILHVTPGKEFEDEIAGACRPSNSSSGSPPCPSRIAARRRSSSMPCGSTPRTSYTGAWAG